MNGLSATASVSNDCPLVYQTTQTSVCVCVCPITRVSATSDEQLAGNIDSIYSTRFCRRGNVARENRHRTGITA